MTLSASPVSRFRWNFIPLAAALAVSGALALQQLPRFERQFSAITGDYPLLASAPVLHRPRRRVGFEDPAELERFLDLLMLKYMHGLHVPGAVFCMVKDGKPFFIKGYGYANLEQRIPVDPGGTLFRVASISKLFMATAAMQLKEQGRLDLHQDVNHYLRSVRIPNTFSRPVTVASLLTHTAGFDEQVLGMACRSEPEQRPLGEYLADRMPERVMPPGLTISYSNHGSALAGCVIEDVAGVPFDEYIERNIFQPLDMKHSSFRVPERLRSQIATGYDWEGEQRPLPMDYMNPYPAGSLITTADDIGRFMIAHLQNGRYGEARILGEEAAREMHTQQYTHHPGIPGICYGFIERRYKGLRTIEHNGLWRGFGSTLCLIPELNTGFFVSCNSTQPLLGELIEQNLLERLSAGAHIPSQSSASTAIRSSVGDLEKFTGTYRFNRYDRHSPLKLASLLTCFSISLEQDHLVLHLGAGVDVPLVQEEPLLFRLSDTDLRMAFQVDSKGRITHSFIGIGAFEHLSLLHTPVFQLLLLLLLLLLFVGIAGWLTAEIVRREVLDAFRVAAAFVCILNVIFVVQFPAALMKAGFELAYGLPVSVLLLLTLPLISTLLICWAVWLQFKSSAGEGTAISQRWLLTALVSAHVVYLLLLSDYNLLGFHL